MQLFHQYPIFVPFVAILLAELLKALIDVVSKRGKIRFINPGGMPSGHAAFVTALAVTVANQEGVGSTAFMIAGVFAIIVMYDAINLRNEAGLHAKAINQLRKNKTLEESLGHNHWEVMVGALFGALAAFVLLNI